MEIVDIESIEKKSSGSKYSFIVVGSSINCSFGDKDTKLTAPFSHGYYFKDKAVLNIADFIPIKNIFPFGQCSSLSNPTVATATAANNGKLQKMPCIPVITTPWIGGKVDVLVENQPALLNTCKNVCTWCGQITITKDGQE